MRDWNEPRIVMVFPMAGAPYGTLSISMPFIPIAWEHTAEFLAEGRQPVGAVVQRPGQPALRTQPRV